MNEQDVTTEPRWKTAGPPYLLTREELLDELHSRGTLITDRQLKSWVTYGLIPRPIRRVRPGTTDGRPHALFHLWTIGLIGEYWRRLHKGQTIEKLKEDTSWLREYWQQREHLFLPYISEQQEDRALLGSALGGVAQAVWKITAHLLETTPVPVMRATLELQFEDGRFMRYALNPYPPDTEQSN